MHVVSIDGKGGRGRRVERNRRNGEAAAHSGFSHRTAICLAELPCFNTAADVARAYQLAISGRPSPSPGNPRILGITRNDCGKCCSRPEGGLSMLLEVGPTEIISLPARNSSRRAAQVRSIPGWIPGRPRGNVRRLTDHEVTRRCFLPQAVRGAEAESPRTTAPPFPPHRAPPKHDRH